DGIAAGINAAGPPILAIHLPSGLDASDGALDSHAIRATATVTIGALKLGLLLDSGREAAGDLWLAPIGFPAAYEGVVAHCLSDAEFRAIVPVRESGADKRKAGAPLILAGSEQFPGAAVLCAYGAARAGAGYVTVATTKRAARAIRSHLIEQVVVTFDERDPQEAVETIVGLMNHCSSLGIGPGLGLSDATGTIVRESIRRTELPIVVDASGLFHLAKHLDVLHRKRVVLTPHAGEFARLSGKGTVKENERIPRLREFVEEHGTVTLLKGQATLVFDGLQLHVNPTGTQALATAGTGDVLTGIIATLLSQGVSPVDAARAGAYWHGVAGQLAEAERSVGVIARDVAEQLAAAYDRRSEAIDSPSLVRVG
ncbi:MAG: NAD(P)H-hydrate dehydratase, partial [Candidatus Eremiobacteraeota bacterium]|nr:NAD(P)H-hydrate dehydratase [Candidatus Eremiobacteraeota bacterium]